MTWQGSLCKAQPRRALFGYPFRNTAAQTEAMPTREGIYSQCAPHISTRGLVELDSERSKLRV